jgi:hypothetical protein
MQKVQEHGRIFHRSGGFVNSQLGEDFVSGQCNCCGMRRSQMSISAAGTTSIGYYEMAVSARKAFEAFRNGLQSPEGCQPIASVASPLVAAWCQTITGRFSFGSYPVVNAKWLVENPTLLALQSMPAEAFVPRTDCSGLLFVSHRWESVTQPDPGGCQSLFLRLFLASRLSDAELVNVGLWYDYSVVPQEPLSDAEAGVLQALLPLIPEIQAAAHTLLCGTVDSIESYSRRAWCLIEYYCGAPVENDFAFGRVSYRQALSHAVATDVTAAVLQSLAYVTLQYVSTEEGTWQCPKCGGAELINSQLEEDHQCLPDGSIDNNILAAWARLDRIESVVHTARVFDKLPEYVQLLLRSRRKSWLEMMMDFNWAHHCGHCRGVAGALVNRKMRQDANEVLKAQLELCQNKCRRFLLDTRGETAPVGPILGAEAQKLGVECTKAADTPLVMQLMWLRAADVLRQLVDPGLVDENGETAAHRAAHWQDLALFSLLAERNPALLNMRDRTGGTVLHSAVFGSTGDDCAVTQWLIEARPDLVRECNDVGEPPIVLAVQYCDVRVVEMLLQRAPELVRYIGRDGNSLLHMDAWNDQERSLEIARLLLDRAPELIDRRNHQNETVLYTAARTANAVLVRLILRVRPALSEQCDADGDTALHAAIDPAVGGPDVQIRVLEIVRRLVEVAPRLTTTPGSDGRTVIEMATEEAQISRAVRDLLLTFRHPSS